MILECPTIADYVKDELFSFIFINLRYLNYILQKREMDVNPSPLSNHEIRMPYGVGVIAVPVTSKPVTFGAS